MAELAEEFAAYLALYNEVRPHEALGFGSRSWCTAEINAFFRH